MPLFRYFGFVGSFLLAMLFIADRYSEKTSESVVQNAVDVDKSVIRIKSSRKWPDPIVFDTSLPAIVPPPSLTAALPSKSVPIDAYAELPLPKAIKISAPVMHKVRHVPFSRMAAYRPPRRSELGGWLMQ